MTNKVSGTGMTEISFKGKVSFLLISITIFFSLSDKGALRIYFSSILQMRFGLLDIFSLLLGIVDNEFHELKMLYFCLSN